jgi:hypothetical protein
MKHRFLSSPKVGAVTLRRAALGAGALALAALAACGSDTKLDTLQIRTLSNRADLVSGGDVLVQVVPPAGAEAGSGLVVRVGTKDVTSAFARRADGRITGLVTGLADGDNVISAQMDLTKLA